MAMPKRLVLVRHGESEINVFTKRAKRGESLPKDFYSTPDREFRLTDKGRDQAVATGNYLKQIYPEGFDIILVSDHTRAKETAALLCLSAEFDQPIQVDPQVGERNWGNFQHMDKPLRDEILKLKNRDPLHSPMPDGETLLEARTRTRVLLERCARQYAGKSVLVITHGEYIESIWSEIAHFRTEAQIEFFQSTDGDVKNCQIVEFASEAPHFRFSQVRSSNPYLNQTGQWQALTSQLMTANEILDEVNKYPRLIKDGD